MEDIASRVSRLRRSKKLPQHVLADALGITQPAYGRKELGKVQFSHNDLLTIARVLQVSAAELMGEMEIGPSQVSLEPHIAKIAEGLTGLVRDQVSHQVRFELVKMVKDIMDAYIKQMGNQFEVVKNDKGEVVMLIARTAEPDMVKASLTDVLWREALARGEQPGGAMPPSFFQESDPAAGDAAPPPPPKGKSPKLRAPTTAIPQQ